VSFAGQGSQRTGPRSFFRRRGNFKICMQFTEVGSPFPLLGYAGVLVGLRCHGARSFAVALLLFSLPFPFLFPVRTRVAFVGGRGPRSRDLCPPSLRTKRSSLSPSNERFAIVFPLPFGGPFSTQTIRRFYGGNFEPFFPFSSFGTPPPSRFVGSGDVEGIFPLDRRWFVLHGASSDTTPPR